MFGAPTPILRSFDAQRTKAFYLDYLGFELEFEHRFADWAPLYLGVVKDGCRLHLSEHYGDCTPGSAIRIPVADVSTYMAQLRAKEFGNSRPGEPQRPPWGSLEITIADPASNRLTFYTADAEDKD